VRFAYADPPYLGCAVKFYGDHPDAAVYDTVDGHRALIERLVDEYPDGWAMSCTVPSLRELWPLCPDDVRIGAWVKPMHVFKKGVYPAHAWEPVIFRGGRIKVAPPVKGGTAVTPRDWVSANITLQRGVVGAKPEEFVRWVLAILNVQPDDEFVDLFPGSGAVQRAYDRWLRERPLWEAS
jgi:hypothetical protein